MTYSAEGFEHCTAKEIEEGIESREYQLKMIIAHNANHPEIKTTDPKLIQEQLDHLRADLILKKQEEREKMKEMLKANCSILLLSCLAQVFLYPVVPCVDSAFSACTLSACMNART